MLHVNDDKGNYISNALSGYIPHDIRVNVLGHTQRGGSPVSWDRLIASAFGGKIEKTKPIHGETVELYIPAWDFFADSKTDF